MQAEVEVLWLEQVGFSGFIKKFLGCSKNMYGIIEILGKTDV